MNHGHVGPVRFISSVEIPKNQPNSTNIIPSENSFSETTVSLYKTVVISGGEGYEEYKIINNSNSTTTLPNGNSMNLTATNLNTNLDSSQTGLASNNSLINQTNNANLGAKNSTNQNNLDENSLGKDDIANYVLTWEI